MTLFYYLLWTQVMTSSLRYDVDSECPNTDVINSDVDKYMMENILQNFTPEKSGWKEICEVVKRELNHNKR